ncbi:MAG: exodeoxyribonuclease VII large subunit [Burkholderiales bacterium]|nr:exodeoxyribonuclease VII large subunit [Burkholderiales bacterium]
MPSEPDLTRLSSPLPAEILSVSALARSVRDLLEHRYPLLWVAGEISNCVRAKSGHLYFSLKDENAQVRCVMFRNRGQYLDWEPREGLRVEVRALVTLYEARGDFQLNVETMRRAGQGALFEAFLRLRDKLDKEGLFDAAHKKPLPAYPQRIGIVTSLQAAALRDVITTLARRNPSIPVIIYPAPVQGEGSAQRLAAAIATAARRDECDVLILCRGGGSIEDLWAFNDEGLARAIHASPIPVVTGIGHETDFTIAEFVADRRAATPTAAAELVAPARADLLAGLRQLGRSLQRQMQFALETKGQRVDSLAGRLQSPADRLTASSSRLAAARARLGAAFALCTRSAEWRLSHGVRRLAAALPNLGLIEHRIAELEITLARASARRLVALGEDLARLSMGLAHLDPAAVLERGYTIARRPDGSVVRTSAGLRTGDPLELSFARGTATVRVEKPH